MTNRKWVGVLTFAAVLCLVSVVPSFAAAVQVGDTVRLDYAANHSPGFNGGGFDVSKSGASLFTTFCLEMNEYFNPGANYYVSNIGLGAINGGVDGGNPDPISAQTQYLYYHFLMGDLTGFDYAPAAIGNSQKDLQLAIWNLEEEIAWGSITAGAQAFVTAANDYVTAGGTAINSVQVMNIVDPANHSIQKQSQVIYVPEPGALLLFGSGLAGLISCRRKRNTE